MDLAKLKMRSNAFVRDIDVWISIAVADNELLIVGLNRGQMLNSRLSTGKPIKPLYSKLYAKKKGYNEPDLFGKGIFQKEMFLETNESNGTYFIRSSNFVTPFIEKMYGDDIFGLEQPNKKKVIPSSSTSLFKLWEKNVLQK